MSVNGINTGTSTTGTYYDPKSKSTAKADSSAAAGQSKASESTGAAAESATATQAQGTAAATYEKSTDDVSSTRTTRGYKNEALVNQLKADMEERKSQLMNIVQQTLQGQGTTLAKADDIWSFLAQGKLGTVSEAARAQAQEDISEDGYWGVKQTSDRILDFAQALVGDDPDKLEEMRGAFEKGFKEATKAWGKDLPDISNRTYDAVMKGFDRLTGKNQEDAAAKTAQQDAVTVAQNSGAVQG